MGYSHVVAYVLPRGVLVRISTRRPTKIILYGINKSVLGRVAIAIRKMRNPDAYKAKGVRFFREVVVLKKREKFGTF